MNLCSISFPRSVSGEWWIHNDKIKLIVSNLLNQITDFHCTTSTCGLCGSLYDFKIRLGFKQIQ
jgi:hypothetical protein